jgi:cytochrome c-type biogenesis protein
MLDLSLGGALLAGLLSFVSPCVLPIVPPYLAWLAGVSFAELKDETPGARQRRSVIVAATAFVLGFSTVFIALGATASVIGRTIAQYFDVLSVIAGIIIIVMGLHFLGVFRIAALYREARVQVNRKPAGPVAAYVVGLAFAFGWTPCVGPFHRRQRG